MQKHFKTSIHTVLLSICSMVFLLGAQSLGQFEIPGSPTIYTQNESEIINADNLDNPMRDGAYKIINSEGIDGKLEGINGDKITTHQDAETKVLQIIKNIINYALGLLSLIALVYLIYHGILMITAAGDDTQYKKGLGGIKFATIAIAGIGLSWIVISFIFYVINGAINGF